MTISRERFFFLFHSCGVMTTNTGQDGKHAKDVDFRADELIRKTTTRAAAGKDFLVSLYE